jgi:hypothetical protein
MFLPPRPLAPSTGGRTRALLRGARALVLGGSLLAGCGGDRPFDVARGHGSASVVVDAASALTANVDGLRLTVSGGSPAVDPQVVIDLSPDADSRWSGFVTGLPVGRARVFSAVGSRAGVPMYEASAVADVLPGGTTQLVLVLNEKAPPPALLIRTPVVDSLVASGVGSSASGLPTVAPGAIVQLSAQAHSPDAGVSVTPRWTARCSGATDQGVFAAPAALATAWTAPAIPNVCEIVLEVIDSRGLAVQTSFTVNVAP